MKQLFLVLSLLFNCMALTATPMANVVTLRGHVTDAASGEPVMGASIYLPVLKQGTVSNAQGEYLLVNLPATRTTIQVSYVGHQTIIETIDLHTTLVKDFYLHENNAMLSEVVVSGLTGNSLLARSPSPVSVVSSRQLQETLSTNIIDAVAHQPGVSQLTTGSGISKPIIRGMGYNRIVVVNDGIRQEGQQWGDEHGIEIDAQTVHSVEILKGPASLMYGSDAMAGVLVMHEDPVMPQGQMQATVGGEYQTNQHLWDYTANFEGNRGGVVWNWRWSEKDAGELKTPADGRVPGSQFHERALTGMLGTNQPWGYSHLKLSAYYLKPGLVEGERDDATRRLLPSEAYQKIYHYKVAADNSFLIGNGTLKALLGYQLNRRKEFEEANEVGLDSRLHTVSYDFHYQWAAASRWSYAAGLQGMWQHSENLGTEYLIPSYSLLDAGVYVSATCQLKRLTVSGGLRLDRRHVHSYELAADNDELCFIGFNRNFKGASGSLGIIYNLSSRANLRLNLSRGFRTPNPSELGSNGEHEGTFRYELGNSQLDPEYSWQADLGVDYSTEMLSAQLSLFANDITNYIFLQRVQAEGNRFQYQSGDARLWGGEAMVDIHLVEPLHFQNTFSMVNAVQLHQAADARYLPFTPAPRLTSDLRYEVVRDGHRLLNNAYVSVGMECYLRQNHVHTANQTETATPSYTLFNMSAGTDIQHRGRRLCSLFLSVQNLFNRSYVSHLSRLKYAADGPISNMGRNVSLKLLVPIAL